MNVVVIICILTTIVLYAISAYSQTKWKQKKEFEKRQEQYKKMI